MMMSQTTGNIARVVLQDMPHAAQAQQHVGVSLVVAWKLAASGVENLHKLIGVDANCLQEDVGTSWGIDLLARLDLRTLARGLKAA